MDTKDAFGASSGSRSYFSAFWRWELAAPCSTAPAWRRVQESSGVSLRVRELVVEDSTGVVRVRILGDVPDAVIQGKRVPRGEHAAGVILYDDSGQERGGYVTWSPSGNVGLTLDSRKGQTTLFVADPVQGSALSLWHGKDSIELRSDASGSRLTAVKDGQVLYQEPPVQLGEGPCNAYREALQKYSKEEVLRECRKRFTDEACRKCLEDDSQ